MSSTGKLKILLGVLLLVIVAIAGYLFYLYQKGGVENYSPPATEADSHKTRVLDNLAALSQAIDAYYAKNLRYPERLEQLQPEFIERVPAEPKAGTPFIYETDGVKDYRIGLADPAPYGLKELMIKNGKLIQN